MTASFKREFDTVSGKLDPRAFFQQYADVVEVNDDGLSVPGIWTHRYYVDAFARVVRFDAEVNASQKRNLIRRALQQMAEHEGEATYGGFRKWLNKVEDEFTAQEKTRWVLITSVSIRLDCSQLRRHIDEARIYITQELPKKYSFTEKTADQLEQEFGGFCPSWYKPTRVHVTEKNERDASRKAFQLLDYLRGVWTLIRRPGHILSFGGGLNGPKNPFLRGPVATVHDSNGKQKWGGIYHYQRPEPRRTKPSYPKSSNHDEFFDVAGGIRQTVKESSATGRLRGFLRRYARAYDTADQTHSFLRLWSLLEAVTNTTRATAKQMIEVVDKNYGAGNFARFVLAPLAHTRNRIVHGDHTPVSPEKLVESLAPIVEFMVQNALHHEDLVDNLDRYFEFLHLPRDIDEIAQKVQKYRDDMELLEKRRNVFASDDAKDEGDEENHSPVAS